MAAYQVISEDLMDRGCPATQAAAERQTGYIKTGYKNRTYRK
jgi:hypothetical protein